MNLPSWRAVVVGLAAVLAAVSVPSGVVADPQEAASPPAQPAPAPAAKAAGEGPRTEGLIPGILVGLNLGYGFSLNYQSTLAVPGASQGDLATAQENVDKYLKTGVPIFTLLELGWLF
jgi:hypothetical protein